MLDPLFCAKGDYTHATGDISEAIRRVATLAERSATAPFDARELEVQSQAIHALMDHSYADTVHAAEDVEAVKAALAESPLKAPASARAREEMDHPQEDWLHASGDVSHARGDIGEAKRALTEYIASLGQHGPAVGSAPNVPAAEA